MPTRYREAAAAAVDDKAIVDKAIVDKAIVDKAIVDKAIVSRADIHTSQCLSDLRDPANCLSSVEQPQELRRHTTERKFCVGA